VLTRANERVTLDEHEMHLHDIRRFKEHVARFGGVWHSRLSETNVWQAHWIGANPPSSVPGSETQGEMRVWRRATAVPEEGQGESRHRRVGSEDWVCEELDNDAAAALAAGALARGLALAVPTDTVYGVAADASSAEAVGRLYDAKGRDAGKPVAVCLGSVADIRHIAHVTLPEREIGDLLPGPVTLCFRRRRRAPAEGEDGSAPSSSSSSPAQDDAVAESGDGWLVDSLNPGAELVGVRVIGPGRGEVPAGASSDAVDDVFLTKVAKKFGGPVALTSANKSSEPSTRRVDEFLPLWSHLEMVFDGGELLQAEGSTVVDVSEAQLKGSFHIIRQGQGHKHVRQVLGSLDLTEA
jgi:L-threonylcarbamoyladenylate synthase